MKALVWKKLECCESPAYPVSREGHSFVYLHNRSRYLLFGGISRDMFDDSFLFNSSNLIL